MKTTNLLGIFAIIFLIIASAASALTFVTYCRDSVSKDPFSCNVAIGSADKVAASRDSMASFKGVNVSVIYDVLYYDSTGRHKRDVDPVYFDEMLYDCESGWDCSGSSNGISTTCSWDKGDKRWYCTAEDDGGRKTYYVYLGVVDGKYSVGRVNHLDPNAYPTIDPIADRTIMETQKLVVPVTAEDANGDTIRYAVMGPSGQVQQAINNNSDEFSINEDGVITWQTGYEDEGNYMITVWANDYYLSTMDTFNVTVTKLNRAPTLTAPSIDDTTDYTTVDTITCETGTAADPDSDSLTSSWKWYKDGSVISGETSNTIDCSTAGNCDEGDVISCEQSVTDDDAVSAMSSAWQMSSNSVTIINTQPSITSTPSLTTAEDALYTYDVDADDADVTDGIDVLTFSLTQSPVTMEINSTTGVVSWTPDNSFVGQHAITVEVTDGDESDTQEFNLTVTNVNDAPLFDTIPVLTATEDTEYVYDVDARDIDGGDSVQSYSLVTAPTGMSIDAANGTITFTANNTQVGNHTVIIEVDDSNSATSQQQYELEVTNAPVEITSSAVTAATEDALYTYDVESDDEDQGASYSLTEAPTGMGIDSANGTITWTPDNSQVGENNVTVTSDDGNGGNDSQAFTITVANTDPIFTSTEITSATEDTEYVYDVDTDDELVGQTSYIITNGPVGIDVSQNGTITWTPDNSFVGLNPVDVMFRDGNGGEIVQSFNITVANVAPTITSAINVGGVEDSLYVYDVISDDEGQGSTSYSLTAAPAGMVIDAANGTITWTPINSQVRPSEPGTSDLEVIIEVDDGNGATDTQTYNITVDNNPVLINSTTIESATEDVLYQYDVSSTDEGEGALSYTLITFPTGMIIDAFTGMINWTPTNAQSVGDQIHNVVVEVNDTYAIDTQDFNITAFNVNDAPTVLPTMPDMVIMEDEYNESVDLTAYFSDIDNVTLDYSYETTGANVLVDYIGTVMNVSAAQDWYGNASVTVIASDGEYAVNDTFDLQVLSVNDAPTIDSIFPLTNVTLNESFNQLFNFTASDVENDTLSTFWQINGTEVATAVYEYDFDTNFTMAGSYDITAIVSDGQLNTSQSWIVDVLDVTGNETPELTAAMSFNPVQPQEGEATTVTIDIDNLGVSNAKNFTVEYYEDDVLIDTFVQTLMAGQSDQVNYTWSALLGTHNFTVRLDTTQIIPEEWGAMEDNNNVTEEISSKLWHEFSGNVAGTLTLADVAGNNMFNWSTVLGNVYAYDTDSVIDWTALQPLGRDTGNGIVVGDFADADAALSMGTGNETIDSLYSGSNTDVMIVYGNAEVVPVSGSTGILWDTSDGGADYDGTQDLVFVTEVDVLGNYQISVPASLRSYTGGTDTVRLWGELQ